MPNLLPRSALFLLAGALLAGGCGSRLTLGEASANESKEPKARKRAPDFELKDSNGQPVRLSSYKGKVVLLNFWATWCGPCKIEIPWFIEFQRNYKDRGFTVLGMSVDEDGWEVVRPFIEARKMNYPVVIATAQVDQMYGGVDALPMTFILDRQGRIAGTHIGLVTRKQYEDEILELLD